MKIFNWVHRKFHNKGENVKNAEFVATATATATATTTAIAATSTNNEKDTQVLLLEHVKLADVAFEGWRDGIILSIGTFGFDRLSNFDHKKEYFPLVLEKQQEELSDDHHDEDDEEDYDGVDHDQLYDDNKKDYPKEDKEGEVDPLVFAAFGCGSYYHEDSTPKNDELEMSFEVGCDSMGEKVKKLNKERTTLADLFSADSDGMIHMINHNPNSNNNNKQKQQQKKKNSKNKGLSFAKKIIPRVGDGEETRRPIKKLHQLVRRMLKRKIHPDLEAKVEEEEEEEEGCLIKHTTCGLPAQDQAYVGANYNRVSLLQTNDAII